MKEKMKEKVALARRLHRGIVGGIRRVWTTKVEVYLLLSEFKRLKLYRLLESGPGDESCAGRRFCTWEGYLRGLGRSGISFGYYAELDRLERRYGRHRQYRRQSTVRRPRWK